MEWTKEVCNVVTRRLRWELNDRLLLESSNVGMKISFDLFFDCCLLVEVWMFKLLWSCWILCMFIAFPKFVLGLQGYTQ